MTGGNVSKIDLAYSGSKVRFSLRGCEHKKDYSVIHVDSRAFSVLQKRLMDLEDKYSWKMLSGLSREQGLTSELIGTNSYEKIKEQYYLCEGPSMGDEEYFFHIRVKNKSKEYSKFRIFGYQKRDLFCITHFDVDGKIHKH